MAGRGRPFSPSSRPMECRCCHAALNDENWFLSLRRSGSRLCHRCSRHLGAVWRTQNPDAQTRYAKKYYAAHRPQRLLARKRWSEEHRTQEREADRRRRVSLRVEMLAAYGDRCACCSESTPEFLALDHIGGGGNEHRRSVTIRGGHRTYLWLKRQGFPKDRFRLLCHNCNLSRGLYGYCPHTTEASHAIA